MKKLSILLLATLLLAGCGAKKADHERDGNSSSVKSSQVTAKQVSPETIKMTLKQAVQKYHEQFGAKAKVSEISLERDHGQYQYEISGLDNRHEYELTLNARTGAVSQHEQETLDANSDDRTQTAIKVNDLKPLAAISKAATKQVGGGTAVEWSLDHENNTVLWEVKVTKGNQTSEVQVDAYTGKVGQVEQSDDD